MMFMIADLITLVESVTTASVWSDYVPESETGPAISIINLANGNIRDIAGTTAGDNSHWRLTVVSESTSEVLTIVNQLKKLDNAKTDVFQKVLVEYVLLEPKQPSQPYRRAFVDVKLYE